jgi:hypothetical protein
VTRSGDSARQPVAGRRMVVAAVVLAVAALVVWVERSTGLFVLWNLAPVAIIALIQYRIGGVARDRRLAAHLFCGLTLALVTVAHLAWLFDWGGTATGSSTAGLMFVVLPIYALGLGGAGAIVAVAARAGAMLVRRLLGK